MINDKQRRIREKNLEESCPVCYVSCDLSKNLWPAQLKESSFNSNDSSFGSLLGISYYLTKEDFKNLLEKISALWCTGSTIVFDYPVYEQGQECQKSRELAQEAQEPMQAQYSYDEIENLLENCGFLIYEHLDDTLMNQQYFDNYNRQNLDHPMKSPKGVHYCLAVKKSSD